MGKTAQARPSNPTPSRIYYGKPFPSLFNPTWAQQSQTCFPPQRNIPSEPVNPDHFSQIPQSVNPYFISQIPQ
jgi:hypothetical protein